ncbi:MAG: hypothetical protein L3K13_00245 [Thermoplasmata archaeon]|nr:hypothetical protein [Thermoplasmata archaeon]
MESSSELSARLRAALEAGPAQRSVWVTDLVDPRIAYFRSIAPVEPTADVVARRESGRVVHDRVERLLAGPEHRELRVGQDGIIGRIDLLFDRPTELKSTAKLPEVDRLAESRPSFIEQLGAYCALLGRPGGRLLLVQTQEGAPASVRAVDCEFTDLPGLRASLLESADRLRAALARRDPTGLPRCAWFHRGCEFEEARICPCNGSEPLPAAPARERLLRLEANAAVAEEVEARLRAPSPVLAEEPVRTFSELLYPRQTYFERIEAPRQPTARFPGTDLWRRVRDAMEAALGADLEDRRGASGEPAEAVSCYLGEPLLVKTSRARFRTPPELLPNRMPHYFVELGLRAGALGTDGGWIVLAYEFPESGTGPVEMLRVRFPAPAELGTHLRELCEQFHEALRRHDPSELPPCPEWKFVDCPYRELCGEPAGSPTAASATGR